MSKLQLGFPSLIANAASFSLIIAAIVFGYVILVPIRVIENWTITTASDKYVLGDTVVITSKYTKNLEATGVATRYLECKNPEGIDIRYKLNDAEANRKAGTAGTGIIVTIPKEIPEINVPTPCRFIITIDYNVFVIRTVTEQQQSKDFTLYAELPAETSHEVPQQVGNAETNPITSPQPTSPQTAAQQPELKPEPTPQPEPTVIDRIVALPGQVLNAILGGL